MRFFALLLLLVASPAFAQESPLVGNWKLVASQISLDNEPPKESPVYGARPKGVLILTREGPCCRTADLGTGCPFAALQRFRPVTELLSPYRRARQHASS
jgi:hypothetical protein